MATTAELNADYDAALKDLLTWVGLVPDQYIPFVGNIRDILRQKLDSPEGHAKLLQLVKDVIAADEAWRAAHPQG